MPGLDTLFNATPEAADSTGLDHAANYGNRTDGTKKGNGFFGALARPDGKVSTELSIGVNIAGKEIEIPSLVPTLTQEEVGHLLNNGQPTPEIIQKAVIHAKQRIIAGKSVFADAEEAMGASK